MGTLFSRTPEVLLPEAGVLDFHGQNGVLYATTATGDHEFFIKGANWFGSEAYNGPPNGLKEHGIGFYLDFLKSNQFNAVRLLFNHEHVLKNDIVDTPQQERFLFQTRYVDMFKVFAREAGKRGILVMIACHRITHDTWPGEGLWYDARRGYSEERVKQSWSLLADALCKHWNVFAADLQNEVS